MHRCKSVSLNSRTLCCALSHGLQRLHSSEKKMRVSENSRLLCLSSSCHAHFGGSPWGTTRGHPSYTGCTTREGDACRAEPCEVYVTASRDEAKHCRSGAGSAIWQSLTSPKASERPIKTESDVAARVILEIVAGEPA